MGMSGDADDGIGDDSGGDSDFEAELAAITSGGKPKSRPKAKPVVPVVDLSKMVEDSLKDIGSDEELSGDDDDPDLLNELMAVTGEASIEESPAPASPEKSSSSDVVSLLKMRIGMYQTAELNAKTAGDSTKARRFNRGLKTLQEMLKKAESGRPIDMDEIPPEVSVKPIEQSNDSDPPMTSSRPAPAPVPTRPVPPSPVPARSAPVVPEESSAPEDPNLSLLKSRQNEYKIAALNAKKIGDSVTALKYIKIAKQFEPIIKAAEEGREIDLSNMPPPPGESPSSPVLVVPSIPVPIRQEQEVQNSTEPEEVAEELITASTVGGALQQRLEKYKSVEQSAKEEGNNSKARRFGRIIKQYEDAIKSHKAGRPVVYDELPCPPGFGPLPLGDQAPKPVLSTPDPPKPEPSKESPSRPKFQKQDSRISGNHSNTSVMEKQIAELTKRQKEFRIAAINAKKSGDMEQAKEYLRISKQFDNMINVAQGGLPVDLNTLPIPPSERSNLEDSFTFVTDTDCNEEGDGDVTARMEEQLQKQLAMCKITRDHLRALGDVASTNRFENLALSVQKDLDLIRLAHKKKLPIPKFHYEMKSFSIVRCHTDLTDNQVDIQVIRGINYNVPNPKDVDTYVKIEFPYPQEETFKTKTSTVKDTDNPEYNQNFIVDIQRSNRACQRVFKRGAIKFEIFSKG